MPEDQNITRPTKRERLQKILSRTKSLPLHSKIWSTKALILFVSVLKLVFGQIKFNWTPPQWTKTFWIKIKIQPWLEKCAHWIRKHWDKYRNWKGSHRRLNRSIFAGALILVVGGGVFYQWWESRPKPRITTFSFSTIHATPLNDKAVWENLTVQFSDPVAPLGKPGKAVLSGITITPKLRGNWKWRSDTALEFEPQEDWGVGETYKVAFEKTIFGEYIRLNEWNGTFQTEGFSSRFISAEFYQHPKIPNQKKVVATLAFSHPVDSKSLEGRVELKMASKKTIAGFKSSNFNYQVSFNKFKGELYLQSDNLPIPEDDSLMSIKFSPGIKSSRGGKGTTEILTKTVDIPGLHSLKISEANLTQVRNDKYEPEQVLVISTSMEMASEEVSKALSVFLLPIDRPASAGNKEAKKYRWYNPEEVGPEVLKLSSQVAFQTIPTENEISLIHTFKYDAPVDRDLYLRINKNLRSFGGYLLDNGHEAVERVPEFPEELKIMSEGSLLALSGEKKLSLLGRGIKAVRFEIGRVLPSDLNHLISQSNGAFTQPDFNNYNFNEDNITERFKQVVNLEEVAPEKTQYFAFDFSRYLNEEGASKKGLFFFKVTAYDPKSKRDLSASDKRFILVTDLGILSKTMKDGSQAVFVQSFATSSPISGATVEVVGKNGISVLTKPTGIEGMVEFPKLSDFKREKEPMAYVVKHGNDLAFLPFNRSDRMINFSRFDIGGEVTTLERDSLKAYLFSERGIYRPGDDTHIGMIIKTSAWKLKNAAPPLEVVVTDPRGAEIQHKRFTLSSLGFEEYSFKTDETSPTGNYRISLFTVKDKYRSSLIGDTTVRVEEFQPDRLRINTAFNKQRIDGWVTPDDLKGLVTLKNLFGTAADERRVKGSFSLSPAFPSFRAFPDHHFFDPMKTDKSSSETLEEIKSDSKGEAEFEFHLERFAKATYRLHFIAEGFEAEGGRGVVSESAVTISPLKYILGYKADGDLQYISKGSQRSVEFIAVDPALKKTPVKGLRAQLIEMRYVSVLAQQADQTYRYQSVKKYIKKDIKDISISEGGFKYALVTETPGDFAISVIDGEDTELSHVEYSVIGAANLSRSLEKNAELQIKLSKADYSPGEEIELEIKAPYFGSGLITIEKEKVYASKWFQTQSTASVQRIRLPANLEGNGYINVSFVRSLHSEEIFTSPLSYGVVPFSINQERRVNKIHLQIPERVFPGEKLKIRVGTQNPGRIVIFAVDEGILQVAKYQTPDPLGYYFKKKSLEVTTSQILDLLLPEFAIVKKSYEAGGDSDSGAIGKNLNPFRRKGDKPVVFWSGIIDIGEESKTFTYDVPDSFNGTLSVFAVVVSRESIGVERKKTFVRGHFVISPNVPTFMTPGDEADISLGIANNLEGSGANAKIRITIETTSPLQVLGAKEVTLPIAEGREGVAKFRVKALSQLGSAGMKFTASSDNKQAKSSVELSLRPASPYRVELQTGSIRKDTGKFSVLREMHSEFRKNDVGVSYLPLVLAGGLARYLETYPFGCTEQVVSKGMPAVVLSQRPEFGYKPGKSKELLSETFRILRARQTSEGGFGYWAASFNSPIFISLYATHFLTEAKEKGFGQADDMLKKALVFLKEYATGKPQSIVEARQKAYAIYLLTRNGVITTNVITSLRGVLDTEYKDTWKKDTTALFLAASHKLLQQAAIAENLLSQVVQVETFTPNYDDFYDPLFRNAQYFYILSRHFPEKAKALNAEVLESFLKPLAAGGYNTFNSAMTILALDAYAATAGPISTEDVQVRELDKDQKPAPLVLPLSLFSMSHFSKDAKSVEIQSLKGLNLFYQITQAGFDLIPPTVVVKDRLEILREFYDLHDKPITTVDIGETIEVHLSFRPIGSQSFPYLSIIDLLPSGFEVELDPTRRENPQQDLETVTEGTAEEYSGEEGEESNSDEGEEGAANVNRRSGTLKQSKREQRGSDEWTSPIENEKSTWKPNYVDIREDRVLIFGSISEMQNKFVYRIKATNAGKFVVPPIYAESMYDRTIRALTPGGHIEVKGKE